MSTLLLPNGLRFKRVDEISAEEMAWFATAEDILRKMGASIMCLRCRTTFEGRNDPTDATITVTCSCRTLKYQVRADGSA